MTRLALPTPADVAAVESDALPSVLAHLAALQSAVAARLLVERVTPVVPEPDRLLKVDEAARLLGRSVSWMRHHGRTIPGFQQAVAGGSVRWSEIALRRWMGGLAS